MANGHIMRQRARRMRESRRTPSEILAEKLLAQLVIPARCQVVIGRFYIADFIGYDRPFVLEIDGSAHDNRQQYDAQRDSLFQAAGFTVIRVRNEDVSIDSLSQILDLPVIPKRRIDSMIWYAKTLTKYPPSKWLQPSLR